MKFSPIFIVLIMTISAKSQNNFKQSWSIGFGVSNHTMAGDHRSIQTGLSDGADANNIFNLGGYLYLDKMFSPAFGLELKGHYTTMAGAGQEISSSYNVNGTSVPLRNTYFEGNAYGAELNLIVNLSNLAKNPYKNKPRKWNLAGYIGMGVQTYDSKLFEENTNTLLVDYGDNPSNDNIANSTYYTAGLGLRYKISKSLDIEFRPTVNLNEEDHLDAAISSKQNMEVFYQTNLGLVFKLNDKEHDNYIWHVDEAIDYSKLIDKKINEYDLNKDTDKDGFNDTIDPCPLRFSKTNKGCPKDSDNDGILDDVDLCPKTPGLKNNNGCPRPIVEKPIPVPTRVIDSMAPYIGYFEHVYFDLDSDLLTRDTRDKLNKVILYMKYYPEANFVLQGNTDRGGSNEYNKDLSERRSRNVKNYMVNRDINENRFQVIGFGEEHPKFRDLPINRNNRRVDIILNE